ncbi:helix-turn-helix domain-containing protein [Fulvimarina endophytica]|uniref:Helix-turn-helix domain-containing protein n=1 Tax=Fulvimarina endophytica TaxID=2293836 RepID=A0A371WYD3_9HYPH|nr:helix-turn-helix domain-containing protein [Fulvimarina endophytica]
MRAGGAGVIEAPRPDGLLRSAGDLGLSQEPAALAPHPDFAARAAIWRDQRAGLISFAEAQRRSALVGKAKSEPGSTGGRETFKDRARPPAPRPRHLRPAPRESRQYAQPMATTSARDDRLTPNAKAFLQVLRARCGKGRETQITKGTMANVMGRSQRTIRRYLADLVRFGYVRLSISRNHRGLHLGLLVTLTEKVMPFYEEARGLARWLAETPAALFEPFGNVLNPAKPGVTVLSPRNQIIKDHSLEVSKGLGRGGRTGFRPPD